MDESKKPNDATLTIRRMMIWTAGVALSLTAVKLIGELRVNAWNRTFPNHPRALELGLTDYLTAIVYGTCLTLFLVALRTKNFWSSPGKIILMIFALICVLDWGLSGFASAMVVQYVSVFELPAATIPLEPLESIGPKLASRSTSPFVTANGYVFGFYYQNLAGEIGYIAGFSVILFVLFQSSEKSKLWKLVWLGFLCFTALMAMEFYGWRTKLFNLPPRFTAFYFPAVIGVPIVAMTIAFCNDLLRKHPVDWWTTLSCIFLPFAWLAIVAQQLLSR